MSRLAGRLTRLAQRLAPGRVVCLVYPDDHPGLTVDQILAATSRPPGAEDAVIVIHGIRHDAQGRRLAADEGTA